MQLNLTPQNTLPLPQYDTGPLTQDLQPTSQYSGTPHANVGTPPQYVPQQDQQRLQWGIGQAPQGQPLGEGDHYQNGMVTTHTRHPTGAEAEHAEIIPTPAQPVAQTARLGIDMGFTKNMGDYQTFRASVHVELPWPVTDIQRGLDECQRIANDRLSKLWSGG